MNGSLASIRSLIDGLMSGVNAVSKNVDIAVCPSYVYLPEVSRLLEGSHIAWGAQNMCDKPSGAYTGEVAGEMLKDFKCRYVIIGHSERRTYYGETDEVVAKKHAAVIGAGMIPILCIGETLDERETGQTEAVVAQQIDAVIGSLGVASLENAVIAYEPVWAIGTGRTATPEQAQEVHRFIRQRISGHDAAVAGKIRILYGGSMKGSNAAELLVQPDIDGGLIGGASLDAKEFLSICQAAGAN